MVLFVRYLLLLALGFGSALVLVNAAATTGRLVLAGSSVASDHQDDMVIWVLAAVALVGFSSLLMFALGALPKMMTRWFERHKDRLATVMLGLLVCLIFVLT